MAPQIIKNERKPLKKWYLGRIYPSFPELYKILNKNTVKNRKRNLTIFSGGRGNKNLFKELIKEVKFDNLSVIINGLDDGASTGEIRRLFNYQAHGISDFLKAITSLSNENNLISFLETRFPKVSNFKERLSIYKNLYGILFENSEKLLSKNHNFRSVSLQFYKRKNDNIF